MRRKKDKKKAPDSSEDKSGARLARGRLDGRKHAVYRDGKARQSRVDRDEFGKEGFLRFPVGFPLRLAAIAVEFLT